MNYQKHQRNLTQIRKDILNSIYQSKKGHLGGALSCVDLIYYLYSENLVEIHTNPKIQTKSSFILSKGHSSIALLAVVNFFKKNQYNTYLKNFNKDNSLSGNNCSELVPGFEFHTGSLGHGIGLGAGVALAKKMDKIKGKTLVLVSDGELHEGSSIESILFADHHNLDLTVIIDNNGQICEDLTKNVIQTNKLLNFFKTNFNCLEINGNNFNELTRIKKFLKKKFFKIIISNTTKGKGIKFMEKVIRWHHSIPSDHEYIKALNELDIV